MASINLVFLLLCCMLWDSVLPVVSCLSVSLPCLWLSSTAWHPAFVLREVPCAYCFAFGAACSCLLVFCRTGFQSSCLTGMSTDASRCGLHAEAAVCWVHAQPFGAGYLLVQDTWCDWADMQVLFAHPSAFSSRLSLAFLSKVCPEVSPWRRCPLGLSFIQQSRVALMPVRLLAFVSCAVVSRCLLWYLSTATGRVCLCLPRAPMQAPQMA